MRYPHTLFTTAMYCEQQLPFHGVLVSRVWHDQRSLFDAMCCEN